MKKQLLAIAALLGAAVGASADVVTDYEINYSDYESFPFHVMGYEPPIINGVLTANNPLNDDGGAAWYQFFIADQIPTESDITYTATIYMKATEEGGANLNMGWGWGDGEQIGNQITFVPGEWKEYKVNYANIGGNKSNLVLQPGTYMGQIEIKWVKVTHEGAGIPTEGNLIDSWYTGNGQTIGGWGATSIENVEEDGKPCLKFTNDESKDAWAAQIAIDRDYDFGVTYYIGFDIKGNPGAGYGAGFQCTDGYKGKGTTTKFNITEEWNHQIIFGECVDNGDAEAKANRLVFDLGKYVGTFYMTNVTLYTVSSGNVAPVASSVENHWTVYSISGVKVMDTLNKSDLRNLPAGLYIVNGKKFAVK